MWSVSRANSWATAHRASSALSGQIVVRAGKAYRDSSMSSKPTMAMSSGIRRPRRSTVCMAPMASRSL